MPVIPIAPRAQLLLRARSPPPATSLSSLTVFLRHRQQPLDQHPKYQDFSTTSTTLAKSHARPPSSQSATSPPSSRSSTATQTLATDINPPASTRPADLLLPSALSSSPSSSSSTSSATSPAEKFKYYIAIGRAYLTFYKTGLKNVYHNYRAAVPLRRSLGLSAYLPTSPSLPPAIKDQLKATTTTTTTTKTGSSSVNGDHHHTTTNNKKSVVISRSTFQLLHRSAYDIRRMIPFTLLLIVCGEFTPLVALALGNAVTPRTCRVPKQLEKERGKRMQRKKMALLGRGTVTAPTVGSAEEMSALRLLISRSMAQDREAVARACAVFGLARSHEAPAWAVPLVYQRRLERYLEYLAIDDELIRRGGGVKAMEAAEVRIAVEERGGVGVGFSEVGRDGWEVEREERRWLEKWLQKR
ncbi:uncharacterized protein BP01DRAFT_360686 [Aspergillus saccharolyticus JOP 1030-1]|uniref:Letm1 RBD domain-containing protein n=1 Tax=Aspergillus saccharolyticus JOP 1030-1 TaxID=1450539 RepID=A0A318Z1E3_9EURO|nr:hypothetical protein BP01DRAFT_360686 [Aspergillus saccharolyticus JOP 1030-1]PYH41115.1 hypothetical protein BP01DRAFT_360686 [Aspergillus saccharolyticus JOP 1030-1]